MPIQDLADGRQRPVSHDRAVGVFDLVEQLNEVAAANVVYLPRAEPGIDQPLEHAPTLIDRAKLLALTGKENLSDGLEGVFGEGSRLAALL